MAVGVSGTAGVEPKSAASDHDDDDCCTCGRCPVNKQLKQAGIRGQAMGLMLVKKPVRQFEQQVIREGSTGRVVERLANPLKLSRVWAFAESAKAQGAQVEPEEIGEPKEELAFYRKYTEAMLRRYLRMSMHVGRVPSLLGRELFRGNVTSYRVHGFEDGVIFCYDVEKRLGRLGTMDQQLIKRIALQQYTQGEAASMLGLSLRNCIRQYGHALDRVTEMFLAAKMLEPLKSCPESCQGGGAEEKPRSASF
jgi:hypothetical protein